MNRCGNRDRSNQSQREDIFRNRIKEQINMANLGIPSNTIEVLQKYNFNFQKKFGQNFLIDTHVLDKIIASANV